jgi:hypothetical protein
MYFRVHMRVGVLTYFVLTVCTLLTPTLPLKHTFSACTLSQTHIHIHHMPTHHSF